MQLPDLKDLAKVIDLCRKKGVATITLGEMKLELREEAPESTYRKAQTKDISEEAPSYRDFPDGELTPEQLMFYSSGGDPKDDPFLKDS